MPEAPYQRIAAELRTRIDTGKLAPGARLPSTRALARRHKVALATAVHALKLLTDEGRIRSQPRVGTIVTAKRPVSAELSRDTIIAAAVLLADEEGLDGVSMRAVAARVGAPPMSIYRHVHGKDELLRAMSEAVLARFELPTKVPRDWRAQL
jgi:DNA-binding transcriptional MocR family regulator